MAINSSGSILNSTNLVNANTVADSTALAALELPPMTMQPGTRVFNQDVGHFFVYTISTEALDPDVVVEVAGITGARWILDTSEVGVQTLVAGSGITIDDSDPAAPIISAAGSGPLFQLALSYGQGPSGSDTLDTSNFWFQPQTISGSPEPDQVHEWPLSRDLAFLALTVFVDDANIILTGDEPRFIVTVDGLDTIYQVSLAAGAHTDELLEVNGIVDIPAGSRIGVRFDGSGVDAASVMRCEMILDGAETGDPIPPPAIPTSGLLLDLASENYVAVDAGGSSTGTWTDVSGNGNDVATGGTLFAHVPVLEPGAFNDDAGVTWTRANSFGMTKSSPTWYAANSPRTVAMVIRGDDISPGSFMWVRGVAVANVVYNMTGGSLPQKVYLSTGGDIQNTSPFFDLNNNKAVLMWWTDGGIGDTLHMSVNGVEATLDDTISTEDTALSIEIGYDEGTFGGGARFDGSMARDLTWNRVLTVSERIGVLSNLTARYL